MGGAVSTGVDNDDLIDNLFENNNLKTDKVVRVFRSVDRAMYFLPDSKSIAYRDSAWKEGHLHISAPCIYAEVLEALDLERGMSFLNIGSGTGYLSTMAGLLLGTHGINHGVEVHESNVKYAMERLQEFIKTCIALRYFDFSTPQFVVGNGLKLCDEYFGRYDRMYVGSACNEDEHVQFLTKFLKVGGKMIVPVEEKLVKITRLDKDELKKENLMSCSFASLLDPTPEAKVVELPKPSLMSLKHGCRAAIVRAVRNHILAVHPEVWMPRANPRQPVSELRRRPQQRLIVPLVIAQNDGDGEPQIMLADPFNLAESNDNGNDAPQPGDFEDDLDDDSPADGHSDEEAESGNVADGRESGDATSKPPEENGRAAVSGNTDDGRKPEKINNGHKNGNNEANAPDDEATTSAGLESVNDTLQRKRRFSARQSCSEGHEMQDNNEPPKRRSGEQSDHDDDGGSSSPASQSSGSSTRMASPVGNGSAAEASEAEQIVQQINAVSEPMFLSLHQLRRRLLSGLRAVRNPQSDNSARSTATQAANGQVSNESSPNNENDCSPSAVPFISPVSLMEQYTVEALQALPYPKNFQRFLNFDRPLEYPKN
ncbi:protein-L-isoaspartate O-methyltransferase domain-containing protein 2-like [Paramacrobiotus metropolitanus]|uniref:protein-L-isoaspartate O-methyltransferase domain-containing protein 2-like n=1 Tax=Paramacrobiotus metropolitanus TaxID=2943436 RepID=UPI0024463886|nr:protein-L-isoaspartate O-methyltransferase domain-containing protein 2-like [Paramacrobiotus metropolitanus]